MPKNQKKCAFYFFMKELQEKENNRGHRIPMKHLAEYAHPFWMKMSPAERQPYEDEAKRHKNDPSLRRGKLASDGTRVEDNQYEIEEQKRLINEMKQAVKNFINADCVSKEHFKEFASRKLFYFVAFNILCQTETQYFPNEIGIIEYSIKNGIHRKYHKFLHPGFIPTGYTGAAKRLSENDGGHGIDIYGGKESEKDISKVLKEIKMFIDPENSGLLPPLFCVQENMELVQGCLDTICTNDRTKKSYFEVWNAVYLLLELRSGIDDALPSEHIATDLLTKPSFECSDSTACCPFHENIDNHKCALLYATQMGYLMSDAVCFQFGITPTKDHLPEMFLKDKAYVVIEPKFQDTNSMIIRRHNQPSRPESQSTCYTETEEDTFSDIRSVTSSNVSNARTTQPSSTCLAAEMHRLNIKLVPATVPGHGVGRGRKPPQ